MALLAALTACGGGSGAAGLTGDDLGTLETSTFSMAFPEDREATDQSAGDLQFTMHLAELDEDEGFTAAMIELPKSTAISLEGALQGAATNTGGEVEDSRKATVDGMPALIGRSSVTHDGAAGTAWSVVADTDSGLFQFMYIVEGHADDTEPPAVFDEIVESIDFK